MKLEVFIAQLRTLATERNVTEVEGYDPIKAQTAPGYPERTDEPKVALAIKGGVVRLMIANSVGGAA